MMWLFSVTIMQYAFKSKLLDSMVFQPVDWIKSIDQLDSQSDIEIVGIQEGMTRFALEELANRSEIWQRIKTRAKFNSLVEFMSIDSHIKDNSIEKFAYGKRVMIDEKREIFSFHSFLLSTGCSERLGFSEPYENFHFVMVARKNFTFRKELKLLYAFIFFLPY